MDNKCYVIFEGKNKNNKPYEFDFENLPIAIKYIHEQGWEVNAIKTPYGYMSLLDNDAYEKVMVPLGIKVPGQDDDPVIK